MRYIHVYMYLVRNIKFAKFSPCSEVYTFQFKGGNHNFEGYTTIVLSPSNNLDLSRVYVANRGR